MSDNQTPVGLAQASIVGFTGFNLRSVILALAPILPLISMDLHLSAVAVGALTSIVLLCLGLGAIPGAVLTNRLGANRVVQTATLALAVLAVARLLPPEAFWLYVCTALLTLAVAFAQPAVAYVIRTWFRHHIPQVSSLFVGGLTLGGVAGASLTPLLAEAIGWRGTFVVWGAVAGVGAFAWTRLARGRQTKVSGSRVSVRGIVGSPGVWLAAGALGTQNIAYFTTLTWVTFLLKGSDPLYIAGALLLLNGTALPLAILLASLRWHYETSPLYYVAASALSIVAVGGLILGGGQLAILLCFLLGLGAGMTFIGAFALPPILARRSDDVPAYSAVMFSFGYAASFVGPWLGGVLVARSGNITAAFWPALAGAVLMAGVGIGLRAFSISHQEPEAEQATLAP
jgi:CP family cyanate transporter-like MFS transporter